MRPLACLIAVAGLAGAIALGGQHLSYAQTEAPEPPENQEGSMTLDTMGRIVKRLDSEAETVREGLWRFTVEKVPVMVVTDEKHNRMRIMVGVRQAKELSDDDLKRLMQANFDSALDARYAIAKDILWAVFIHPLRTLHDRQFIAAIGQTVNLALTYGTTYTSGLLTYGGGDSNTIIQRELIDRLLKKGEDI